MDRVPMTVDGAEALRTELQHLKKVERPKVIQDIAEARAHGDLKENAEYHAAREKQSFLEGRIADIEGKLSLAQIIDISKITNTGKVIFGSTVTLFDLSIEKEATYKIVGDDESDISKNKISVNSPIARGLIGKQEGDEASINTPSGEAHYEIVEVQYI